MRLKIPLTGTVTGFDPEAAKLDGIGVSGDPNDLVRAVNLNTGNVRSRLVGIDLENDLMEVEVTAPEKVEVAVLDTQGEPVLKDGKPTFTSRLLSAKEKLDLLANAQHILESKTADEIYAMTGDKRLVKPADVMERYRTAKATTRGV